MVSGLGVEGLFAGIGVLVGEEEEEEEEEDDEEEGEGLGASLFRKAATIGSASRPEGLNTLKDKSICFVSSRLTTSRWSMLSR